MALQENPKGIKFDATINLGHIITFIGFIITGFLAWQTMDKRVIILEQGTKVQELRDQNQDMQLNSQGQHIADSLADLKHAVEKLSDKLEKK
jgi:H+/gluconate symporter-like permease